MLIQEAIRSGRPARRHGWATFRIHDWPVALAGGICAPVDILADDWEIEEERLSLSWEEIQLAHNLASGYDPEDGELLFSEESFKHYLGFRG